MTTHTYNIASNWSIAYSPYVDTLHMYQNKYNKKNDDELVNKNFGTFIVVFDSKTREPLLFEMKLASKVFGDNIEKMDKKHIIQDVIGYINDYGES